MSIVTVSSGCRVVIPCAARDALGIRPGQKLCAFAVGARLIVHPADRAQRTKRLA